MNFAGIFFVPLVNTLSPKSGPFFNFSGEIHTKLQKLEFSGVGTL